MEEIAIEARNALDIFCRPLDEEHDPLSLQHACASSGYAPQSLALRLPKLKSLQLTGYESEWSDFCFSYFVRHLPASLISLALDAYFCCRTQPQISTGSLPLRVLAQLEEFTYRAGYMEPHGLRPLLQPIPNKSFEEILSGGSSDQLQYLLHPLMNLRVLRLRDAYADETLRLLQHLTNLEDLELIISNQWRRSDYKTFSLEETLILPSNLTSLSLLFSYHFDISARLAHLPHLTSLKLTSRSDSHRAPLVLNYMPPQLTKLEIKSLTPIHLECLLPGQIRILALDSPSLVHQGPQLDTLNHLTSLNTSKCFDNETDKALLALPPNLTRLSTATISLSALSGLPKSLQILSCILTIESEVDLSQMQGITQLTRPVLLERLRVHLPHLRGHQSPIQLFCVASLYDRLVDKVKVMNTADFLLTDAPQLFPPSLTRLIDDRLRPSLNDLPDTLVNAKLYALRSKSQFTTPLRKTNNFPSRLENLTLCSDSGMSSTKLLRDTPLQKLTLLDFCPSSLGFPPTLVSLTLRVNRTTDFPRALWDPKTLPNLKHLDVSFTHRTENPFWDLREMLPRLEQLETFAVDYLLVDSDLLPIIPSPDMIIELTSAMDFFRLLLPVLPSQLIPGIVQTPPTLLIEWNPESLSKLPRTLTSLHLRWKLHNCPYCGYNLNNPLSADVVKSLPLALTRLDLSLYQTAHFSDLSLLPRTLKHLVLNYSAIVDTGLNCECYRCSSPPSSPRNASLEGLPPQLLSLKLINFPKSVAHQVDLRVLPSDLAALHIEGQLGTSDPEKLPPKLSYLHVFSPRDHYRIELFSTADTTSMLSKQSPVVLADLASFDEYAS